jgi:hypothetical protein
VEHFFKDPDTLRQKRQGPLGRYIDEFAKQLSEQGYSQHYACRKLQLWRNLATGCGSEIWALGISQSQVEAFFEIQSLASIWKEWRR